MKKRIISFILILTMLSTSIVFLTSCGGTTNINYEGELHVVTFGDYLDPNIIYRFEDQTGIMVILDTYQSNDEIQKALSEKGAKVDLACITDYLIPSSIKEGAIQKFDYNNIPNIVYLDNTNSASLEQIDENIEYSIPHVFGTYGILYNTSMIPKGEITSWKDLWKEKYKGKIMTTDVMRDLMMIAMKSRGHSENSTNVDEITQAADDLIKLKPSIAKQGKNSEIRAAVVRNEIPIGVVPSGEVTQAKNCNSSLEYVLPSEGTELWNDCWCIPSSAENKENAERFVNYLLHPDNAAKNQQYMSYGMPNIAMYFQISPRMLKLQEMFPCQKGILRKCEVLKDLDEETYEVYEKNWQRFLDA